MADEQDSGLEAAYEMLVRQDSCAALDAILDSADGVEGLRRISKLARRFYWKDKKLGAFLSLARTGIAWGLVEAHGIQDSDPATAAEMRHLVKGFAYDIGSFTWPGWLEPGFDIGATELAMGRDAAAANLRMAVDLKRGDLPTARAHWLVGAHHLAANELESALQSFRASTEYARSADKEDEALLAQGYVCLTRIRQSDPEAQSELDSVLNRLRELPDGAGCVDQLTTAGRWLNGARSQSLP